jgi:predicted Na+-dependent transporter
MIILPVMIYHLIQLITCAVLARVWSRTAVDEPAGAVSV